MWLNELRHIPECDLVYTAFIRNHSQRKKELFVLDERIKYSTLILSNMVTQDILNPPIILLWFMNTHTLIVAF